MWTNPVWGGELRLLPANSSTALLYSCSQSTATLNLDRVDKSEANRDFGCATDRPDRAGCQNEYWTQGVEFKYLPFAPIGIARRPLSEQL